MSDTEVEEGEPQYSVVFSDDASGTKLPFLNRDGRGTARYANGDSYCGDYLQHRRHGQGVYTFRNGCSYSGSWQQGVRHGEGSMSYPDKGRYSGGWAAGKRDGYGVYSFSNGDQYSGGWVADRKQGKGVYAFARSGEEVKGEWSNGRLTSGVWQQRGCRVIGNFRQQQPSGLSLVVNARGQAAAGQYTDSVFLPLPSASAPSLPSSASRAAASSQPAVVAPPALTVASRLLENCVLSLSHCEGIYRLLRTVPGAPNFRRIGESAVFVSGQPSVEGAKAAVAAVREAAGCERVVWLDAREELLVYVGDRGFTPRHPKRATLPLPLPPLSVQEAETLEANFAQRLQQRVAHRGGLLAFVKETYADLPVDRRCLQCEDDVSGAAVRSPRQLLSSLAEDDGLAVEYACLPPLQDVDGVCSALRPVLADGSAALLISDWMGKEAATWVAVVALLLLKLKDGGEEQEEAEVEPNGRDAEQAEKEKDRDEKGSEEKEQVEQEGSKAEEEEKQQDEDEQEKEDEEENEPENTEEKQVEEQKKAPAPEGSGDDAAVEPATAAAKSDAASGSAAQHDAQLGSAEPTTAETPANAVPVPATVAEAKPTEAAPDVPSAAEAAASPAPAAPAPLNAEEKARLMRSGSYAAVSRVLSLLGAEGVKAKAAVDAAADAAADMLNVRECVRWAFEQWEAEGEAEHRAGERGRLWLRLGRDWLQRYCSLILLTVWLRQEAAASKKAQAAAAAAAEEEEAAGDSSSQQAATVRFADWLAGRPDITAAMSEELQAFAFNI